MRLNCMKTELHVEEAEPLTSSSQNIFEVAFSFGEEWRELSKTVIFRSGQTVVSVVLGSEPCCRVPYEVLREPGTVYIGVYGTGSDCILTTAWCLLGVVLEGASGGEPMPEPTPTVYQQILELQRQALEEVEAIKSDAENGVFDGADGADGRDGADGLTPTIGENGNWHLGAEDTGLPSRGERGYSGLVPLASKPYAASVLISANVMTEIGITEGALSIDLGAAVEGFDNEWCFVISQGETAHDIILPEIEWTLGMAPSFEAGSVTEVRVCVRDGILKGVWNV